MPYFIKENRVVYDLRSNTALTGLVFTKFISSVDRLKALE